jgi:hypothetical protein
LDDDLDKDGYNKDLDCDDSNSKVNPGATEVCNGIDDDCDGSVDEGVKTTYYHDADGDTYTNNSDTQEVCSDPDGSGTAWLSASTANDCDDNDVLEHPGQTWYLDADGDDYSDGTTDTTSCERPTNYFVASELTATIGDCDDSDNKVNPGATEIPYNDKDDDCNSSTLDDDLDKDGYNKDLDCDDSNSKVNPGATEIVNGIDDNCDGNVDVIDSGVHHLGDGAYSGSVNSQFQMATEGTTYTKSFTVDMLQLYSKATLSITHRGVQKADPIRINGQLIRISSGWNSPSDGSLGTSTISFDINILKAGANNISITASYDSGSHDYDDFEFTNIYVTLSP